MTPEFLDAEYTRVVAERYTRGVEYWRERFALLAAQPVRKVRVFSPDPVEPRPASLEPRYGEPMDRRTGKRKAIVERKRLTKEERAAKHRAEQRRYRESKKAEAKPHMCCDCGEPTGRVPRAPRCKACAYKRKVKANGVRQTKKYHQTHGITGYIHARETLDIPAIIAAVVRQRTAEGCSAHRAAAEIGIAHSSLFAFEKGEQTPRMAMIGKLCAWLGVEPEAFLRSAA